MFNKIKSWFKNLFKEKQEETEEVEIPQNHTPTRNFEEVFNMFLNGVKDAEQQDLMRIRETTPIHMQNCTTCYGCKYHTKEGGTVYCCPKWIPKNY